VLVSGSFPENLPIQNQKPVLRQASKIQSSKLNAALAKKVALSCQILAKLGLFKETTGHVSARSAVGAAMFIRGRGREESGIRSPC